MRLIIFLIGLLCISLAAYNQNKWITYESELDNFLICFPQKPSYSFDKMHRWLSRDFEDSVTYQVMFIEAPKRFEITDSIIEKEILPLIFQNDIRLNQFKSMLGDNTAIECFYKSKGKPTLYKTGMIISGKKGVYVLFAQHDNKSMPKIKKFLDSFKEL